MYHRRAFLQTASFASATVLSSPWTLAAQQPPVKVELPRLRVPLSFIIDDSTSLVNMGRFCMPQFATAWPDRREYDRPWQTWPAEIPDDFLRRFAMWCAEHDVRGKFSMVPYPACVGWLDREIPGWSRKQLNDSLKLVREWIVPRWDIHPEMITHTRVIDLKSGRPMPEINPDTMENSYPQVDQSVDELASYLAYALRILKNCDLPCEGITTPGGFGNKVKAKLPLAVFDAVRDVYGSELPHYFKYVSEGDESTEPRLEGLRDADADQPSVTVNIPAGTGDWFGGWDGARKSEGERYANHDASAGRMVELIERRVPAVMLCHWPGLYGNGSEEGFQQFQSIVMALHQRYVDQTQWMKISEIGRYWAAKELTKISPSGNEIRLQAPFACRDFTVRLPKLVAANIAVLIQPYKGQASRIELKKAASPKSLQAGSYVVEGEDLIACFDLARGSSTLQLA